MMKCVLVCARLLVTVALPVLAIKNRVESASVTTASNGEPLTWLLPCADEQYRVSAALSKRPKDATCYPSGTCKRVLVDS